MGIEAYGQQRMQERRRGGRCVTWTMRAVLVLALFPGWLVGCSTAPPTTENRNELLEQATATIRDMNRVDPGLEALARKGHGYAVFPEITKGGLVFGGAYGRGVVYEQGKHIGYADLTQASFGLQAGGQTYSELIVFETKPALDRFEAGRLDFTADATAVILMTGAAANARFVDGVTVIVRPLAGAMAEASVGGQQFKYVPK
jgi:lipid-binding SYLF domain-containing protein